MWQDWSVMEETTDCPSFNASFHVNTQGPKRRVSALSVVTQVVQHLG